MKNKGNIMREENTKIEYFPIEDTEDEVFDEFLRKKLKSDADEYEKQLEDDASLANVKAPDEMYEKIVRELKSKNLWEEGEEKKTTKQERSENFYEENKEEVYAMLSKEDRKAMQLGQKLRRRRKWTRWMAGIAAVFAVFVIWSTTSTANKLYVVATINRITGSNIQINTTEDLYKEEMRVDEACKKIEEKLGIEIFRMGYIPEGLELTECEIGQGTQRASLVFLGDQYSVNIEIKPVEGGQALSGWQNEERYTSTESITLNEKEYTIALGEQQETKSNLFSIELVEGDAFYQIYGNLPKEEMESLLKNLII